MLKYSVLPLISTQTCQRFFYYTVMELPKYYNNDKGSLYKVANERNWNAYLFDVVKRLERGGKKDPIKQEIEKSIGVLQLWLSELEK